MYFKKSQKEFLKGLRLGVNKMDSTQPKIDLPFGTLAIFLCWNKRVTYLLLPAQILEIWLLKMLIKLMNNLGLIVISPGVPVAKSILHGI